ncbi:unnamed protein product [Rhizoctonia solani]|uniref:BHLH domain-containing protein n=1 Tax=Rhizoctonia solani TaxID=456999 RepID=A0A8H3C7Z7_9AGAM|nr:unnamed protein product [Rhizoctonia solani]
MTLLGQHEYVEYSPLFIAMDPRFNPNTHGAYVYQPGDPRTVDSSSWGMYSPTYANSTIQVAQGKEHLQSATSALMSLQSEPSHTPDQYGPLRPPERQRSNRSQSECQSQDDWQLAPGQATSSSLLGFDSQLQSGANFTGSGNYLQGAHRWASNASSPSTPTLGSAVDGPPSTYLSGTAQATNYPSLITHAPQPLHAQPASGGPQFMALHSAPLPSSISSPTIVRPHPNSGGATSTSSRPSNLRRRSSTSNSASSSNTLPGSSLGLHVADPVKTYTSDPNAKLARSRSTLNLTSDSASGSAPREKPKLLTKDQKKRNHIHSEQKRRATIRHGYALLCEEVPSLRMAIAAAEADDAEHVVDGESRRRRRSRGRSSAADGERIDGRAGPRTIDHLKDLLATRQELLSRVQELRAGDPGGDAPWERIWDGGTGLAPEGVEDDGEEDGEGESDEADS